MWNCPKCREHVNDRFQICWNCGTSRDGVEDPSFRKADDMELPPGAESIAGGHPPPLPRQARPLTIDQLIFVGLNGYAMALDRDTGVIVWANREMHGGYVSLLLDGDRLICSTNGYTYCLDPLDGTIRWHNPLSGFGLGAPTALVSRRGQATSPLIQQADEESSDDGV